MRQITEKMIKRKVLENEKEMERIIFNLQQDRENCYGLNFQLVGFLNRLDLIPDFVIPIFVCLQDIAEEPSKIYYFQVGNDENDTLIGFSKLNDFDEKYIKNIYFFEQSNSYTTVRANMFSKPLYAFQSSKDNIFIGTYEEMKAFLEKYKTEDSILKEEIQDFMELESQNIWSRLQILLNKNFPDDSKEKIEIKLNTLKNAVSEDKSFELYILKFNDLVLRVGVCVKGEDKKAYFPTKLGEELQNLLMN